MVPMQLSARALKTTMAQAAKTTKTAAPSQMVMDGADSASWPEQTEDEANAKPQFEALSARQMKAGKTETRRIFVPPHRYTPLKQNWEKIYGPLVEQLQLQVRMNLKRRSIELRTSDHTVNAGALQKGDDFCRAFTLGFELQDAIALLRLDDLYIHTFEIHDVKQMLAGDHMSRAIGRVAGKGGKTKFTIENATKTRIGPDPPGVKRQASLAFYIINRFCIALLYGRAGRLTAQNGGSGPGSDGRDQDPHPGVVQQRQDCPRRHLPAHPGRAAGQGLQQAAAHRRPDERAFLSSALAGRASWLHV